MCVCIHTHFVCFFLGLRRDRRKENGVDAWKIGGASLQCWTSSVCPGRLVTSWSSPGSVTTYPVGVCSGVMGADNPVTRGQRCKSKMKQWGNTVHWSNGKVAFYYRGKNGISYLTLTKVEGLRGPTIQQNAGQSFWLKTNKIIIFKFHL